MTNDQIPGPEIRMTGDGSATIYLPDLGESYHSLFGAMNESIHVFIQQGLEFILQDKNEVSILEIGMGTGLNALLTCIESHQRRVKISYKAIEPNPLPEEMVESLNYPVMIGHTKSAEFFKRIHQSDWETSVILSGNFGIFKSRSRLEDLKDPSDSYDLVYFDAFSPAVQPELWTTCIFRNICRVMRQGGVLVTYSAKGEVRRNLRDAGFAVERLPGPKGKREMLRGIKI